MIFILTSYCIVKLNEQWDEWLNDSAANKTNLVRGNAWAWMLDVHVQEHGAKYQWWLHSGFNNNSVVLKMFIYSCLPHSICIQSMWFMNQLPLDTALN